MKQPTILIATPYYAPRIGGLENYAQHIAEGLSDQGWRVVVVCGDTAVKSFTAEQQGAVTVYRLPIWKVIFNTPFDLRWYKWLKRIILMERPDIVNAHTPVPFMVDMAGLAAGKIPFVTTYHAATLLKPSSPIFKLIAHLYLIFQRFITLRRTKAIIAVSPYVHAALGRRYAAKTKIVFNAVSVPEVPKTVGNGLIFIANLEPTHTWKGLHLILQSLALINDKSALQDPILQKSFARSDLAKLGVPHLTIVGDGAARPDYEAQVKQLGLTPYVTFAGRQTGAAKDALIADSAVLIAYPTTANDAFPTVFLEAWALNRPIIAADIGPIPSLIKNGKTGVIVPPNDPEALATAIINFFDNPQAGETMGQAGRKLVESTYNWPRQVQRTKEILEVLI